jgi:hypothetical protein
MASKVSEMLGASIDRHVLPLMAHLGLASVRYPERLSVGTVARALGRALDESRTLFVTCWCDGGTATNLTWRLDVYDGRIWDDLQITFPFATPGEVEA